jgi:hypothetical protein
VVVLEQAEDAQGLGRVRRVSIGRRVRGGTSALCVSCEASWKRAAAWWCSSPAVAMLLLRVAVWALRTCSWAFVRCADSMVLASGVACRHGGGALVLHVAALSWVLGGERHRDQRAITR